MSETESKLTESANEITLSKLLEEIVIWSIPFFQRPYQWKRSTLEQFQEDLHLLVQGEEEVHFMGVVIYHDRPGHIPGNARIHDLIDGQQRLTTIFLHVAAIVQSFFELSEAETDPSKSDSLRATAERYTNTFLIADSPPDALSHYRLHSSGEDMAAMNKVMKDTTRLHEKHSRLRELPSFSISHSRTITNNFKQIKNWIGTVAGNDPDKLTKVLNCMLTKMTIVSMKVKDPYNGPKIFSRLNAKQHRMSSGDLIRNEVFNKLEDKSAVALEDLHLNHWKPFYDSFEAPGKAEIRSSFEKYFFPLGLIHENSLKKSEVFDYFFRKWGSSSPKDIIKDLSKYQAVFLAISEGHISAGLEASVNRLDRKLKKSVIAATRRLVAMRTPASAYPYLMQLFFDFIENTNDPEKVKTALSLLGCFETFLVRRAVCGIEPTGLHALFKVMYTDHNTFQKDEFWKIISSRKTITIVKDADFIDAIKNRDLYDVGITQFLLSEYDISMGGDTIDELPEKEHILPQTIDGTSWVDSWSEVDHLANVNRLGNLLPVTPGMNKSLSNNDFDTKIKAYKIDSKYKATREFGSKTSNWELPDLEQRASDMADWALNRWPAS